MQNLVVLGVLTVLDLLMLLGALTETLDDFVQVAVNTILLKWCKWLVILLHVVLVQEAADSVLHTADTKSVVPLF